MVKGRINNILVAMLVLAALVSPALVYAELQVKPARNSISMNESLQLEITLEDGDADALDLGPLEQDFDIVGQARGSQVNIINGSMSKINTWSLRLLPKRSGELSIPALCAGASCSAPVAITVSDTPANAADAVIVLEHGSLPRQVFVGQQVLYKVRLLCRTSLQQAALSAPEPAGVECEMLKIGDDIRREEYRNGWRYDVIERIYAIVPEQSGTLHLPPVTLEAEVGGGQERLFDPFGRRGQLVRYRTEAAQIEVLPAASSAHPWVPAQELELEDSWAQNPPHLRVGEPATRSISVRAHGTTAAHLGDLELNLPAEFKIYPDQPERDNLLDGDSGITAQLRQSVAVVPRSAGTFTLPPITVTWWDMRAQRWSSASIDAQEVTVLPAERAGQTPAPPSAPPADAHAGGATPPPAPASVGGEPEPAQVKEQASAGAEAQDATATGAMAREYVWPLVAGVCACGWLVTLLLWWRRRNSPLRPAGGTEGAQGAQGAQGENVPPAPPEFRPGAHTIRSTHSSSTQQQLIHAAQRHDAQEARHLLQHWAATSYPESPAPMETLMQQGGEQLCAAVEELNAILYSGADQSWDGTTLAQAIQAHAREVQGAHKEHAHANDNDLPPLYPQA